MGVKPEHVEAVWEELGMEPGNGLGTGLNYIKACPGEAVCRLGQRDSLAIAERIYDVVKPMGIETKLKFGISGCPLACGEGVIRDIGIFGKKKHRLDHPDWRQFGLKRPFRRSAGQRFGRRTTPSGRHQIDALL